MKKTICALALLSAIAACKKDHPDNQPAGPQTKSASELATQLQKQDSLTVFANVLANTQIPADDFDAGITVLAPVNSAFTSTTLATAPASVVNTTAVAAASAPAANVSSGTVSAASATNTLSVSGPAAAAASGNNYSDTVSSPALTTENTKDHIIKGKIDWSKIQSGDRLKALSGKVLQFIKSNDSIWVNGVLLNTNISFSSPQATVYTVKKSLSNTHPKGTITVTVYNTLQWNTDKPKGDPQPDTMVYLFRSQKDYADTRTNPSAPKYAYSAKTNSSGVATFTGILPGKYYISAGNGYPVNIANAVNNTVADEFETTVKNGLYYGFSSDTLVQSASAIPLSQPNALPGSYIWQDANGDGIINGNDLQILPQRSAQTPDENATNVDVLIGVNQEKNNSFYAQFVNLAYANLSQFEQTRAMTDGYLSQDATSANGSAWTELNKFYFTPANTAVASFWNNGWTIVANCNQIIANSAYINNNYYPVQAGIVRAYTYIELLTYFGNIPLATEGNAGDNHFLPSNQGTKSGVLSLIQQDLDLAINNLPDNTAYLNKWAAYTLAAKLALLNKDYNKALDYSGRVINSGKYALENNVQNTFQNVQSKEVIWAVTGSFTNDFVSYFYGRNIFPALRYAEVLLINAEANIMLGNNTMATATLNMLQNRSGRPPIQLSNAPLNQLNQVLKEEAPREGYHFASLVRWNLATQELAQYGYKSFNNLLPIPVQALNANSGLVQNPGY